MAAAWKKDKKWVIKTVLIIDLMSNMSLCKKYGCYDRFFHQTTTFSISINFVFLIQNFAGPLVWWYLIFSRTGTDFTSQVLLCLGKTGPNILNFIKHCKTSKGKPTEITKLLFWMCVTISQVSCQNKIWLTTHTMGHRVRKTHIQFDLHVNLPLIPHLQGAPWFEP